MFGFLKRWFIWIVGKLSYFGSESNLHGVHFILAKKPLALFGRIFWILALSCSIYGVTKILMATLSVYGDKAVSFSVETSYLHWESVFPAISICEIYDRARKDMYFKANKIPRSFSLFYEDVTFLNPASLCRSCANCIPGSTCLEDLYDVAKKYRAHCDELLTDCWWRDELFKCCDRFYPVVVEFGTCFVFNTNLAGNHTKQYKSNLQSGPGKLKIIAMESVSIDIHSPDDATIVNTGSFGNTLGMPFVSEILIEFKIEETISDPSVLKLPIESRECRFFWEKPYWYKLFSRYSYNGCLLQCKAYAQISRCNCTHHLMPVMENIPRCDLFGLRCLAAGRDMPMSWPQCNCLPVCEETQYQVIYTSNKQYEVLTDALIDRGSIAVIQLTNLPTLRVRRQVFRDLLSLIVDIGGVAGVFFGASILSIIEFFYLFFRG